MRNWTLKIVFVCIVAVLAVSATPTARSAEPIAWTSHDDVALRELLEGTKGQRQAWEAPPELVILASVMRFGGSGAAMSDAVATTELLGARETALLESDMTRAIRELTGGRFSAFSGVRVRRLASGERTPLFERGRIVVGRFKGIREQTGTLGYGGRTTRNGAITAGVVMLDRDFDRDPNRRRNLRMHELGHALGYNHVEARPSLMNPRVGSGLTAFDRAAIEVAHAEMPSSIADFRPAPVRR